MSAYIYLAKVRILTSLAYRFDVVISLFVNMIALLSIIFFWKAAYNSGGAVAGISEQQMLTYSIISSSIGSIFSCSVQSVVVDRIREGSISVDLYKPLSLYLSYFIQDIGESASSVITRLVPTIILSALLIQLPLPASTASLLLFIPSCLLCYGILWLLSSLVSLTAFWYAELGDFGMVKDIIVRLLSGSVIPIWFFPKAFQQVSQYLPFQYTYQTALGIYVGRIHAEAAVYSIAVQAAWLIILLILFKAGWNKAKNSLMVQGG